jgi:hypothetical protein
VWFLSSAEKLEFTRSFLIYGNLALLAWVLLAFLGVWFYNQIYSYLLLLFTVVCIYLFLRRLGCSSCYYCKACTSGFGRLAGVFFGTGWTKKGSVGNRVGFIGFIYFLLSPLPLALLGVSLVQSYSALAVLVFACLLAFSAYSFSTWLRNKVPTPSEP